MGKLNTHIENGHGNNKNTPESLHNRSMKNCRCCCCCIYNDCCCGSCEHFLDLDKEKLLYRAEGNANLVLSLPDYKKVLRLRKICVHNKIIGDAVVVVGDGGDKTVETFNLNLCVEYIKLISTIIGHPYTYQPTIVNLKVQSYEAFNKWLLPARPVERLDKEVYCSTGILYPDVTFLPDTLFLCGDQHDGAPYKAQFGDTFSVEIKPKQGWTFNSSDFTNSLFNLEGVTKCRFCCMQFLKLQKKSVETISGFCPIDLFSGNPLRMNRAIAELIHTPQNNFCILKNGKLVFGNRNQSDEITSIVNDIFHTDRSPKKNNVDFINLLIKILLHEFRDGPSQRISQISHQSKNQRFQCEEVSESILPKHCVLKQILDIQLLAKNSLNIIDKFKQTSHPYAYINDLLRKNRLSCATSSPRDYMDYLDAEEKYLLGATALDCSIMLTFRVLSKEQLTRINDLNRRHLITIGEHHILANVTVMDLDPKPVHHFTKYIQQTNLSHEAYCQQQNSIPLASQ